MPLPILIPVAAAGAGYLLARETESPKTSIVAESYYHNPESRTNWWLIGGVAAAAGAGIFFVLKMKGKL